MFHRREPVHDRVGDAGVANAHLPKDRRTLVGL